jgi:hypothetical protein
MFFVLHQVSARGMREETRALIAHYARSPSYAYALGKLNALLNLGELVELGGWRRRRRRLRLLLLMSPARSARAPARAGARAHAHDRPHAARVLPQRR